MANLAGTKPNATALSLVEWLALTAIFTLALWLRLRNLGALGLYGDADHTYFAVKGILETGFPWMPSGMFYPRALLYSYLAAGSSLIFGLSEFSLRLPNVIFSLMAMAILYRMLKEFFGCRVALLTSLLFSVSVWDIEMARHARMYEALLFFTILSTWVFYKGFMQGEIFYRVLVLPLFILTTSIHSLGVFLVTLFVCPFLVKHDATPSQLAVGMYGVAAAIASFVLIEVEHIPYDRIMEPIWLPQKSVESGVYPDFSLLRSLITSFEVINIIGVMGLISLCVLSALAFRKIRGSVWEQAWNRFEFGTLVVTVIVQQFGVAFWMLGGIIFSSGRGIKGITSGKHVNYSSLLIGGLIFWIIWVFSQRLIASSSDSLLAMVKEMIRTLFFYPWPTILIWIENFPIMMAFVIVGLVLLFDRGSKLSDGRILVVMIGFLGPLVAIGFFKEYPMFRYLYMVYPFFLAIYVWVIHKMCLLGCKEIPGNWFVGLSRDGLALALTVCLVIGLSENHSLGQAFAVSERTYSTQIAHNPLFHYRTHPDHQSAGLFVKRQRGKDDMVIAMDFISAAYAGTVDYIIRTKTPTTHHIHLGAPFILNLPQLQHTLSQHQNGGRGIWLITSNELLGPHRLEGPGLNKEILNFLTVNNHRIVFSSPDSVTKVYLFSSATSPNMEELKTEDKN